VESEGELLLVISGRVAKGQPVVYMMDTKNCLLEPLSGIGSRALFVSLNRSISVDTSVVHTVQSGSIYYADMSHIRAYDCDLRAWEEEAQYIAGYGVSDLEFNDRPNRLDEILAGYCRRQKLSEFQMAPYYEDVKAYRENE
jgi:hypothetical protein